MEKKLALLLALSMTVSMGACGKEKVPEATTQPPQTQAAQTQAPVTLPTETIGEIQWVTDPPLAAEETTEPLELTYATEPELELPKGFKRLETPEIVYALQSVNIRMEPYVNAASPGKLHRGEQAQRIAVSGKDWSAVVVEQELCYIASRYLTTEDPNGDSNQSDSGKKVTETPAGGVFYTNHWVNLRQGPGADTALLGTVPAGEAVQALAICSNGWYKISCSAGVGYVAGGYLTSIPVLPQPEPTVPETTAPKETEQEEKNPTDSSEGTGSEGTGGTGNEGAGGSGTGNEGAGGSGSGNEGAGGSGTGNEGAGGSGTGNEDTGGSGTGNEGAGGSGTGNEDTGGSGSSNEGAGGSGTGNEGTGDSGTGK